MPIDHLFPTPIYYADAPGETREKILCEFMGKKDLISQTLEQDTWGDNISTTFHKENLIVEHRLESLSQFVVQSVCDFCDLLFKKQIKIFMDSSWVNYQGLHQFQERHNHIPSLISGVYYLKADGDEGDLRIFKPSDAMYESDFAGGAYANAPVSYKPTEGRIIIFPGWVPHGVMYNKTDKTRISVTFNFKEAY